MNIWYPYRLILLVFALALVACGDGGETASGAKTPTTSPAAAATAAKDSGQPRLRCPAKVRKDLQGPDIIGLQLGMTLGETLDTARCALGEDAVVKTENHWLKKPDGRYIDTYGIELGTQALTVKQGDNRPCNYQREWQSCEGALKWEHVDEIVTVATPGTPGRETAMVIWRTQNFREGQMPPAQSLLDALIAKYGEPQHVEHSDKQRGHTAGYRDLRWLRDRRGSPLTDSNPLFRQCFNTLSGRGESTSVSWRDGCGLNVWARVYLSGQNSGLAMELNMGMVQQSDLWAHGEATQAELQQLGQARRDAEVQKAGDAGVKL
jgi:hypothetical protein